MATDTELVAGALRGEQAAFAEMYDTYATRLHDFCFSMLRNRDEAADAMQDTFVCALERIGQLRDPERLRAWLYAIARHECLRRIRGRKRISGDGELPEVVSTEPTPDEEVSRQQLVELVWAAAEGLADRDRALLDLNLRHGLEGQELAEAVGVEPSAVYVMLSRLRDQVDRSLGALLVARVGRRDCDGLQTVLAEWDGSYSPLWRKRVARHVDGCTTCSERRRLLVSPSELLAGVPLLAPPEVLRRRFLDVASTSGAPSNRATSNSALRLDKHGFPRESVADVRMLSAGTAAAAVALFVGIAIWPTGGGDSLPTAGGAPLGASSSSGAGSSAGGGAGRGSKTRGSDSSAQPTTTGTPISVGSLTLDTSAVDFGSSTPSVPVLLMNTGGTAIDWTATGDAPWLLLDAATGSAPAGGSSVVLVSVSRAGLSEGPLSGSVTFGTAAGNLVLAVTAFVDLAPVVGDPRSDDALIRAEPSACPPTVTTVHVSVADGTGIGVVTLHWLPTGAGASTADHAMNPGTDAGDYTAELGHFANTGVVQFWVTASDPAGHETRSGNGQLTVGDPCIG